MQYLKKKIIQVFFYFLSFFLLDCDLENNPEDDNTYYSKSSNTLQEINPRNPF